MLDALCSSFDLRRFPCLVPELSDCLTLSLLFIGVLFVLTFWMCVCGGVCMDQLSTSSSKLRESESEGTTCGLVERT
jgi:hypothetical protein